MTLNEQLAEAALAEVRQLVQVYSSEAVISLRELSRPPYAPKVRVQAAKALAGPVVSAVTHEAINMARPIAPKPASPELLAEIEREKQIYQLGEEALAKREQAIEGEAANV